MKILVFSDSHGSDATIRRALELHVRTADLALHAGDGAHSFMLLSHEYPSVGFLAVRGNCDSIRSMFGGSEPLSEEQHTSVCGHRLMLTHGHRFGVKSSTSALISYARVKGADIIVFGHTHEPCERYVPASDGLGEVRLFNPGAAKDGLYGIIEIRENGILMQNASIY